MVTDVIKYLKLILTTSSGDKKRKEKENMFSASRQTSQVWLILHDIGKILEKESKFLPKIQNLGLSGPWNRGMEQFHAIGINITGHFRLL